MRINIKINGFEYMYETRNGDLTLDGKKVDRGFMTANEKQQLENAISNKLDNNEGGSEALLHQALGDALDDVNDPPFDVMEQNAGVDNWSDMNCPSDNS